MNTIASDLKQVGRNWSWMLAYGILLVVLGIFAMTHPLAMSYGVGIILSVSFLFSAGGALIAAFRDAGWQAKTVDVLFGVLSLLAAIIFFVNPFSGALTVIWVIGVMFLIMGGFEFVAGFRSNSDRVWLIMLGVVDMLIGFWATFFMPPTAALVALATLVGLAFMFRGILLAILAFKTRGLAKA